MSSYSDIFFLNLREALSQMRMCPFHRTFSMRDCGVAETQAQRPRPAGGDEGLPTRRLSRCHGAANRVNELFHASSTIKLISSFEIALLCCQDVGRNIKKMCLQMADTGHRAKAP